MIINTLILNRITGLIEHNFSSSEIVRKLSDEKKVMFSIQNIDDIRPIILYSTRKPKLSIIDFVIFKDINYNKSIENETLIKIINNNLDFFRDDIEITENEVKNRINEHICRLDEVKRITLFFKDVGTKKNISEIKKYVINNFVGDGSPKINLELILKNDLSPLFTFEFPDIFYCKNIELIKTFFGCINELHFTYNKILNSDLKNFISQISSPKIDKFDEINIEISTNSIQNNISINKKNTITLFSYINTNIHIFIKEKQSNSLIYSQQLIDHLLNLDNDILGFDIDSKKHKKLLIKILKYRLDFVLKVKSLFYYENLNKITSLFRIQNDLTIFESQIEIKSLFNLYKDVCYIVHNYLIIENQELFNHAKNEIQLLYEAYDKLYTDITGNVFDTQSITIKKTLLKEKIEASEITEQIEKSVKFDNVKDNNIQSELKKNKTNLEENLKSLNSLINKNICNNSNKNEIIRINDSIFKIIRKKELFKPLFYYNFNKISGENEIIINLSNEQYKLEHEDFIINMACTLYYTKSTMTSNTIEMFINRLLSNLTLIQ